MSDELILYHYDGSPFAEKVRLAMGLKKLIWRSVHVPTVPPRSLLDRLTGGYRRIPVMQIGADIYCDTHLILRTLDRLRPDAPSLLSNSTTQPLCWWWDKATFVPAATLWFALHGNSLPQEFLEDRKKFAPNLDLSKVANEENISLNVQRIKSHLGWLTNILTDGRLFLQGEPSALDITAYHILWFARKNFANGAKDILPELYESKFLFSWYERVAALGHGISEEMTSEQAFEIAKQAEPAETKYISTDGNHRWSVGDKLSVTPDDMGRVPVEGTLVAADDHEIVLRLFNEEAGNINVHFPRAGFDAVKV